MAAGEYLLNPIPMYGKYAASWCFRGGWVKSCSWFCLPCINHPRKLCTNQQTQNATIVFNIFVFSGASCSLFFLGEIDHLTCFKLHNLASTVAVVCESNTQEIVSFHINWWANEIKWDQMSTCLGFKQKPIERFIYHSNLQPFLCDTRGARNGRKLNLISFETLSFKSCVSDASEEGQRTTRTSRISSIDPFNIMVVELLELQRLFQPISYVTEDGKFATRFFSGMYIYIYIFREREISTVALYANVWKTPLFSPWTIYHPKRKGSLLSIFPKVKLRVRWENEVPLPRETLTSALGEVGSAEISVPPWCFGGKCVGCFWQGAAVLAVGGWW